MPLLVATLPLFFSMTVEASAGPVTAVKTEDGKTLFCQYQSDLGGVGYQLNLPIAIAKQDHIEMTLGIFGVQCARNSEGNLEFTLRQINDPFQNGFMDSEPITVQILAHHAILLTPSMRIVGKQPLENKIAQIVRFELPLSTLLTKKQLEVLNSGTEVLINLDYFNRARIEYRQASRVDSGGDQDGGVFRLSFTLQKDPASQKLVASPIQVH